MNSADERQGAPAPAPAPQPPATRDACLFFRDGRLVGLETGTGSDSRLHTVQQLVAKSLLSITDRMILDQIAARVDKLVRQLDAS